MKKRKLSKCSRSSASPFSSKIVCGECGGFYGSKVWHSNSKYKKVIWQCNKKFKNKEKCKTPHLSEKQVKDEFIKAFNNLLENKESVIKDCEEVILSLIDTKAIDDEILKLEEECEVIVELMKSLIYENSRKPVDQDEYNKKYNFYTDRYETIKDNLTKAKEKKHDLMVRKDKIDVFINQLKLNDNFLSEFNEKLWYAVVDKAIVDTDGTIHFKFKNEN